MTVKHLSLDKVLDYQQSGDVTTFLQQYVAVSGADLIRNGKQYARGRGLKICDPIIQL